MSARRRARSFLRISQETPYIGGIEATIQSCRIAASCTISRSSSVPCFSTPLVLSLSTHPMCSHIVPLSAVSYPPEILDPRKKQQQVPSFQYLLFQHSFLRLKIFLVGHQPPRTAIPNAFPTTAPRVPTSYQPSLIGGCFPPHFRFILSAINASSAKL